MQIMIHQVSIGPKDGLSNKTPGASDGLGVIVWASWLWSFLVSHGLRLRALHQETFMHVILKENFFIHFICDYT